MVVGMVNAGVMTLVQAIGVITGANIGTTITGWIVSMSVDNYGLPLMGIAALIYLFIKYDRVRFTAMFVLGLGMVFYGLELMKTGFLPLRDMQVLLTCFIRLSLLRILSAALLPNRGDVDRPHSILISNFGNYDDAGVQRSD